MALRDCPVCHTHVKLENLERHVANVHPREEPSAVLSEGDRRAVRRETRKAAPAFHVRRAILVLVAVVSISVAGVVLALPYLPAPGPAGGMATHWHPQLTITIANIGIDSSLWQDHTLDQYGMEGMAPLHTHDALGTIHVESRVLRDYTLGDFFRIWGQTFDAQQVLGHAAQSGHRAWMVVDGTTMSPSDSVVLRDRMDIQIICGVG